MEHNFIIITDEDDMGIRKRNLYYSDFKVEYLGEFMEMSYVVNGAAPLHAIKALLKV